MTRAIDHLIIGDSPVIRELRQNILRYAPLGLNVVIMGPTGAGKELVAKALHDNSGLHGAFVPTNVCAIPDTMFESTMFGHRRGAFTGAVEDARGLMCEADGGSLFLDEVGDLNLTVQVKLLRAIDTGSFRPVGARADVRRTFRTITATNRELPSLVSTQSFRGDLWYRLSGAVLRVPPLSARVEDIPLLSASWLRSPAGTAVALHPTGARALMAAEWPGHVRELKHVVTLASAIGGGVVDADGVAAALSITRASACVPTETGDERAQLLRLLAKHDWRPSAAAAAEGVHVATMYRRFERVGIRIKSARGSARQTQAENCL